MSLEADISDALLRRVGKVLKGYSIAYPNVDFTPQGEEYLDVDLLPNSIAQETFSGDDPLQGALQITVVSQKGIGVIKPQTTASKVVSLFPKGARIFGRNNVVVTVQGRPTLSQTFIDDAYTRTPITIQYIAC